MKKRVMIILFIALTCLSLTGCSSSKETSSENTSNRTIQALEVLFHKQYLDIADIKISDASSRDKLIKKIENALQGDEYQIKEEPALFDNYYAVTSQSGTYVYYGSVKDNKPNGFGVLGIKDGSGIYYIYAGDFKKGRYDGYGAAFFTSFFTCAYDDSNQETILFSYMNNYVVYSGEWDSGKRDGEGTLYGLSKGSTLKGYWAGDTYPDVAVGSWKKDKLTGDFKVYEKHVLKYDGELKDGLPNGEGTLYYSNGKVQYKGEWKDNKYHGKGTLYDQTGKVEYSGKWKNGDYAS